MERILLIYSISLPFHFQIFCRSDTPNKIEKGVDHADIYKHVNPVVRIANGKEYNQGFSSNSGYGGYSVKYSRTEYNPVKYQKNQKAQDKSYRNKKFIHMKPQASVI